MGTSTYFRLSNERKNFWRVACWLDTRTCRSPRLWRHEFWAPTPQSCPGEQPVKWLTQLTDSKLVQGSLETCLKTRVRRVCVPSGADDVKIVVSNPGNLQEGKYARFSLIKGKQKEVFFLRIELGLRFFGIRKVEKILFPPGFWWILHKIRTFCCRDKDWGVKQSMYLYCFCFAHIQLNSEKRKKKGERR